MEKSRFIYFVGLLILAGVRVSAAESSLFDDEFLGLIVERSDSSKDAVDKVNRICRQEENEIRNEFNQEKRKVGRSLESINQGAERRKAINRGLRKLNKSLAHLHNECAAARKDIAKQYSVLKVPPPVPEASRKQTLGKAVKRQPLPKNSPPPPIAPKPVVRQPVAPRAETAEKNFQIHGQLKNEVAYRIDKPHEFTKNRFQALLQESYAFNDQFKLRVSERAFYDTVAAHFNDQRPKGSTVTEENDLESDVQLRDAYLDGSFGDIDVRLGKQQIVWGEAVGVFVADAVNGQDLREYILPDFDWIRRPQWSVDVVNTQDASTVEGVVSLPEFDKLGTRGSEFAFPFPDPGVAYVLHEEDRPQRSLSNADVGGRASYLFGGLDIGAYFLHTWNKFPVIERSFVSGALQLTPTYQRMDILGATFSKNIGDSIFKGEFSVKPDQPYSTADPLDSDGVAKSMTVDYVLGFDRTFFEKIDSNVQLIQTQISEAENLINEKPTQTHFSFWLKTDFFQGDVTPEILAIVSPTVSDHLFRPKITFKMSDSVLFRVGADVFKGHAGEGLFGIFDGKSRTFSEIEYHF